MKPNEYNSLINSLLRIQMKQLKGGIFGRKCVRQASVIGDKIRVLDKKNKVVLLSTYNPFKNENKKG